MGRIHRGEEFFLPPTSHPEGKKGRGGGRMGNIIFN
jgi:hypothetical protein